jgi:hypothetical protein
VFLTLKDKNHFQSLQLYGNPAFLVLSFCFTNIYEKSAKGFTKGGGEIDKILLLRLMWICIMDIYHWILSGRKVLAPMRFTCKSGSPGIIENGG